MNGFSAHIDFLYVQIILRVCYNEKMEKIEVTVKRSARRTLAVQIKEDGSVVVRAPWRAKDSVIIDFLDERKSWIAKNRSAVIEKKKQLSEIEELTEKARELITERVEYFSEKTGIGYGRIAIRHQKTRWGSCSAKGNLNFNCLLALAPSDVLDYVVVHELCHRIEMNHSDSFWALVENVLPDYRTQEKWLKENGSALMAGMYPVQ